MRIQFDETNLLSDIAGKGNGISRSEVERSTGRALKALKSFRRLSEEGKYGFPHLPFQTAVVKQVGDYAASVRGSYDSVCLVGIGRSALGAWALDCGIRGPQPTQGADTHDQPLLHNLH